MPILIRGGVSQKKNRRKRTPDKFSQIRLDEQELEEILLGPMVLLRGKEMDFKKLPVLLQQRKGRQEHLKSKWRKEYLLVDGYNIIFAWEDLNELAKVNIEAARK